MKLVYQVLLKFIFSIYAIIECAHTHTHTHSLMHTNEMSQKFYRISQTNCAQNACYAFKMSCEKKREES